MRVGIGGISCECCTFSPLSTGKSDFSILRKEALLAEYPFITADPDVQFIPLIRARALPGGPVDAGFYSEFKRELLELLRFAGPLDGLLLHMHGALYVTGLIDAEGDLIAAIRKQVGPSCLISASYDLHGNLSLKVVQNLDVLTAYRTAPHIDWYETVRRAFDLLIDAIRNQLVLKKAFIPIPILLPGEQTSTEWEPAADLYGSIPAIIKQYSLTDASILIGYVWADEPRAMASVVAFGSDAESVQLGAANLAESFWSRRGEFVFGSPAFPVDESIRQAMAAKNNPVIISDAGDNPTAGGAGDLPFVLERLLALNAQDVLVASIPDASAVARCREVGVGAEVEISLGGKLDPIHGRPLPLRGRVVSINTVPWSVGTASKQMQEIVTLQTEGVQVIITEQRTPFHYVRDFERLGLDPGAFRILVVKIGYLEPELKTLAAVSLTALSPGAVDQKITELPFRHLSRPLYPFDEDLEWQPPRESLL
jgi:microcystin degradation protein MlrC